MTPEAQWSAGPAVQTQNPEGPVSSSRLAGSAGSEASGRSSDSSPTRQGQAVCIHKNTERQMWAPSPWTDTHTQTGWLCVTETYIVRIKARQIPMHKCSLKNEIWTHSTPACLLVWHVVGVFFQVTCVAGYCRRSSWSLTCGRRSCRPCCWNWAGHWGPGCPARRGLRARTLPDWAAAAGPCPPTASSATPPRGRGH